MFHSRESKFHAIASGNVFLLSLIDEIITKLNRVKIFLQFLQVREILMPYHRECSFQIGKDSYLKTRFYSPSIFPFLLRLLCSEHLCSGEKDLRFVERIARRLHSSPIIAVVIAAKVAVVSRAFMFCRIGWFSYPPRRSRTTTTVIIHLSLGRNIII